MLSRDGAHYLVCAFEIFDNYTKLQTTVKILKKQMLANSSFTDRVWFHVKSKTKKDVSL